MKILIFGGGGFIGSTIVDRLLFEGHAIRIFERQSVHPYRIFGSDERVEWVVGDFSDVQDVNAAVKEVDTVLHLVSTTMPKNSNDDPIYDVQSNLVASLNILNAMVMHGVSNIIFISSGGTVYGNPIYLPIDEKHPTNPLVSYGVTKLAIEKYLQIYESLYGIKAITLRVSNPYGERQSIQTAQGAVGVFLHHALNESPIQIWGDGSIIRDYIYVGDVAEAFLLALSYKGNYRVFNIGSGFGLSINSLIDTIENTLDIIVERNYFPGRSFDVIASVLDNNLAKVELKWEPAVKITEGIRRTAFWLKSKSGNSIGCK